MLYSNSACLHVQLSSAMAPVWMVSPQPQSPLVDLLYSRNEPADETNTEAR
jgi:hypothetical protein